MGRCVRATSSFPCTVNCFGWKMAKCDVKILFDVNRCILCSERVRTRVHTHTHCTEEVDEISINTMLLLHTFSASPYSELYSSMAGKFIYLFVFVSAFVLLPCCDAYREKVLSHPGHTSCLRFIYLRKHITAAHHSVMQ